MSERHTGAARRPIVCCAGLSPRSSVLSPNCLYACRTVGKAIRRLKDTSKGSILVWFSLANAMIEPATKGDGICETPH
jgi:hypothetical protein